MTEDVERERRRGPSRARGGLRLTPRLLTVTISTLLVLAFLGSAAFILTRHGGTVFGSRPLSIVENTLLSPQLLPGDTVVQPVEASDARLSGVAVSFGTYAGTARCDLRVSLHEMQGTAQVGGEIASAPVSCAALPDNSPATVLTFPPLADSAGKAYDLVIARVDSQPTGGVAIWAGTPRAGSPSATVDGTDSGLTGAIRPVYDPRPLWASQLGTIVSRMADYGPSWATGAAYVALLVLLVAAIASAPVLRHRRAALITVVVVAALARGFLWSATIPAFSAMDEPAHFSNVQYIAEQHAIPKPDTGRAPYSAQIETAIDRLGISETTPGDRPDYTPSGAAESERAIDSASPLGGGGGPAATYSPAYYAPAALFVAAVHGDFFGDLMAARVWSIVLGALAAALLVLIGGELFPRSPAAMSLFAVAGVLQPMAGHQFAIVNNDAWVIAVGFAAFLVALKLANRGRAPVLSLAAGLLVGAAILGKPFGIAVVAPLAVGWIAGKARVRNWSVRGLVAEVGLVAAGVAVTYGAWLAYLLLNHIPGQAVPAAGMSHGIRVFLAANFDPGPLMLMWGSQMWGDFGWVRIPFEPPIPMVLTILGLATVAGLGLWLVGRVVTLGGQMLRRTESGRGSLMGSPAVAPDEALPLDTRLWVTTASLAGMGLALYAAAWMYYASTGRNDLLQGRYALMVLPAILAAPALLAERVHRRWGAVAVTLGLALLMAALLVLGLRNSLESFYG
ncbi:MAG TPA: DUF2142 domain-containing protein [Propionicimonas sp.]|jgi:hypothetical protein